MMEEPKGRPVGGTEYSWCRAVPGGTGIAVLAILTSKTLEALKLQNAINKLQKLHPVLRSKLHSNPSKNSFSFITSSTPYVQIKSFNLSSTRKILESLNPPTKNLPISPLQSLLEHELNQNVWWCSNDNNENDMFLASMYSLPNEKWVVVLRLHVSACDRTTAVSLLRELQELVGEAEEEKEERGGKVVNEINLGIEDLIPSGKVKKSLWTRGIDMLSYSMNSFRSTNLKFIDVNSPRCSQVVRIQMNKDETERIISGCKSRGIKLCGALAAAGVMAAQSTKCSQSDRKYAVVTFTDCRSILEPPLSAHHFGFYHSAIMNTHIIRGGEQLWELAKKMYMAFANSKKSNRHFSDMADLNFLMCKAIENPGLTSSSSLRTSLMSVFEDTVVDDCNEKHQELVGLEDYIGCASVHGLGPSMALFDTLRGGRLDCVCVYPSPLHSREQMQGMVDCMKSILVNSVTESGE
ncbi:hypothetical protein Patl1_32550 [Pistacia atlantica]|uniref:Uncharacterized protein n=1 Tax=Pistacia atlantica TaxID=434234 RepID=A0ACC1AM57_9ROSI|nr:hypothetical protein Patl1_32550 [Pistacia atlantica]